MNKTLSLLSILFILFIYNTGYAEEIKPSRSLIFTNSDDGTLVEVKGNQKTLIEFNELLVEIAWPNWKSNKDAVREFGKTLYVLQEDKVLRYKIGHDFAANQCKRNIQRAIDKWDGKVYILNEGLTSRKPE